MRAAAYAICASCSASGRCSPSCRRRTRRAVRRPACTCRSRGPPSGARPIDLERRPERLRVGAWSCRRAARPRRRTRTITRAEVVAVVQAAAAPRQAHPLSLAALPQDCGVARRDSATFAGSSISMSSSEMTSAARPFRSITLAVAEQDGMGDAVVDDDARGAQDLRRPRLPGTRRASGRGRARLMMPRMMPARPSQPCLELLAVVLDVDELLRDAAGHGRPRHGRRDPQQHPRIEGEGNQVVAAELHRS